MAYIYLYVYMYALNNLPITCSDNGMSPYMYAERLLSIGPSETNFSEMLIKFKCFHSRKCVWRSRLHNDAHCSQHQYANMSLICHGWNCDRELCLQFRFVCFGYIKNNRKWGCEFNIMAYDLSCVCLCSQHAHVRFFPIKRQLSRSYFCRSKYYAF